MNPVNWYFPSSRVSIKYNTDLCNKIATKGKKYNIISLGLFQVHTNFISFLKLLFNEFWWQKSEKKTQKNLIVMTLFCLVELCVTNSILGRSQLVKIHYVRLRYSVVGYLFFVYADESASKNILGQSFRFIKNEFKPTEAYVTHVWLIWSAIILPLNSLQIKPVLL
jgi:hypothetical protein